MVHPMNVRSVVLAALVPFTGLAAAPAKPSARCAPPTVESIREEAQALVLIQNVLSWYTQSVGEPQITAETFKGHEHLFSRDSIAAVSRALGSKSLSADERRALEFLKAYLATEAMGQAIAHFDDEAQNAELTTTVRLSWIQEPVPYKQLEILSQDDPDPAHRAEIEKVTSEVWEKTLNPILERKEVAAQQVAKRLGYASYVALSEESRRVKLEPLIAEGRRFFLATDALYRQVLADVAQSELGMKPEQLHRSDIGRLRKAPTLEKFFPKELEIPAFQAFLSGIGLDLTTAGGKQIRVDDSNHPLKEPRAACFNVRVPDDVRISVKPTGGVSDFTTFFHEGGHAVHFANTTTQIWEFQQLGSNALTEGIGELFGYSWDDPIWLRHYRQFVTRWNAEHHTTIPVMTDADIARMVRLRVFNGLYFLRRYASAKLVYEAVLHNGPPQLWAGVYSKPTNDLKELYRDLFSEAYGFPLSQQDALRFRTDVDDTFYSADYTRAFALAHLMHEGLRAKFGGTLGDWYANPQVGPFLKEIFATGQKLQPDEVAQRFGMRFDFTAAEHRLQRLGAMASH